MEIIIDVQGFQGETFIAKELAWITIDQEIEEISSTVFKPPYSWDFQSLHYQRLNKAIIAACHKISWTQGQVAYNKLNQVIEKAVADKQFIYVKGLEKKP
ncbi:unnamed protein product [Euphydryas editha]|uniref:Uncharacterized protein n=1 Tax=Euphydryas editha TaxID=104508 RepID=A0AAU9TNQ9_EUPED|nr:unnamed protein product [Euphydryas editha]